jgi:hypothetical protein
MRLEFEAYKKQHPALDVRKKPVIRVIVESDEETESDEEVKQPKKKSPPPKPTKVKSVLQMIDDSDDEDEKVKPVNVKDHKIVKALECDFID